ncbi:MAG: LLM class flavin-dependent oxidoreductase [Chloroflexota bacterium]|nr:LLM class flavin-dependent oxidoreductase [Dehalococcoidia bacterium]MDW8254556.1 LLM class flavin-dependent oxidoreductase [Chloroflexota bacterium]
MRIGLANIYSLRPGSTWRESWEHLVWQVQFGDAHGFANFWLTEHHFTEYGASGSPSVILANLAALTRRIRLGYSVALLPFHHPVRLAEEMLLIDQMSQGRLDIGVGRGHAPLETAVLCPDPERAVDLFEDAFALIALAFRGKPFAFAGKYWRFPEIQLYPLPYQQHPEMYMVMTSPRSIAFAAQHGAIPVLGNRPGEMLREQLRQYEEAARAAGTPEDLLQHRLRRVSASRFVAIGDSRQEAYETALREVAHYRYALQLYQLPVGDPAFHREIRETVPVVATEEELLGAVLWGTASDLIEQLRELERVGIRQLSISLDSPVTPPEEGRRRLERFTREVLPALDGAAA